MDQAVLTIFQAASQLGALGVALLALYWTRQDKAEAVKAFTALNEERKQMAEKQTKAIEDNIASRERHAAKYEALVAEFNQLEQFIRDRIK